MRVLKEEGKYEILEREEGVDACQFLERVGRTAYQSGDKITDGSAHEFIRAIIKKEHEAVLAHWPLVWFVTVTDFNRFVYDMLEFKEATVGAAFTYVNNDKIAVSGNVRTLRDGIRRVPNALVMALAWDPVIRWPLLFKDISAGEPVINSSGVRSPWGPMYISRLLPEFEVDNLNVLLGVPQSCVAKHQYLSVVFKDNSRGQTHEQVRHTPFCAYLQESTRYVKQHDLHVVAPPCWDRANNDPAILVNIPDYDKPVRLGVEHMVSIMEQYYSGLLDAGWKAQDARQFLPIGVTSEIVHTASLEEWHWIFTLRAAKPAHWEIKRIMKMLLADCIERWPEIFTDLKHLV